MCASRMRFRVSLVLGFFASCVAVVSAQHELSWHSVDGGGAMFSTGGGFELGGTIGQADAGLVSGGDFELHGGFWTPAESGPAACTCGDVDRSGGPVNLGDFATFAICFGLSAPNPPGCDAAALACSDMDASGMVDLGDFATFAIWFGSETTLTVPNCQ